MEAATCWGLWAGMSLTSFALCGKRAQRESETLCEGCPMVTAVNSAALYPGSLLRDLKTCIT